MRASRLRVAGDFHSHSRGFFARLFLSGIRELKRAEVSSRDRGPTSLQRVAH